MLSNREKAIFQVLMTYLQANSKESMGIAESRDIQTGKRVIVLGKFEQDGMFPMAVLLDPVSMRRYELIRDPETGLYHTYGHGDPPHGELVKGMVN